MKLKKILTLLSKVSSQLLKHRVLLLLLQLPLQQPVVSLQLLLLVLDLPVVLVLQANWVDYRHLFPPTHLLFDHLRS